MSKDEKKGGGKSSKTRTVILCLAALAAYEAVLAVIAQKLLQKEQAKQE